MLSTLMLFPGTASYSILFMVAVTCFGKSLLKLAVIYMDPISGMPAEAQQVEHKKLATKLFTNRVARYAGPVAYVVMLTIIYNHTNTQHYYIYRCFDDKNYRWAVLFGVIYCFLELVLDLFEVWCYSNLMGSDEVLKLLKSGDRDVSNNAVFIVASVGCVAALFTSCFFVQHDGIALLGTMEKGIGNCK